MSRRRARRLLLTLIASVAVAAQAHAAEPVTSAPAAWVEGQVLVGVGEVPAARASRALEASGAGGGRVLVPRAGIRLVATRAAEGVPEALARLRALPEVEWAEPSRIVRPQVVPNDPFLGEQYWVHNVGQSNGGKVTAGPDGTWTRSAERAHSGSFSLNDSAGGPYANDADPWVRSATPVNLVGRIGCRLDFQLSISSQGATDGVFVETSTTGGATWTERDTFSGEFPAFTSSDIDLTAVQGTPDVRVGFRLVANGSITGDGAHIDDVAIRCLGGTPGGRDLNYASGTSFAAPVVAGIAALVLAERPGLGLNPPISRRG